ncbi:MAG: hypothetical protein PHI49_02610 [Halothiobacillaceae bacterium]|jgi:hypothetical protein|nr:hypothetical protein [Halothiobacillaceae bacterium]
MEYLIVDHKTLRLEACRCEGRDSEGWRIEPYGTGEGFEGGCVSARIEVDSLWNEQ